MAAGGDDFDEGAFLLLLQEKTKCDSEWIWFHAERQRYYDESERLKKEYEEEKDEGKQTLLDVKQQLEFARSAKALHQQMHREHLLERELLKKELQKSLNVRSKVKIEGKTKDSEKEIKYWKQLVEKQEKIITEHGKELVQLDMKNKSKVVSSEVHDPSDSVPAGLICGIEMYEDLPVTQHIQESEKESLPRSLLQLCELDSIQFTGPLLKGKDVEIAVLDSGIHLHHEVFRTKGEGKIDGRNFVPGEDRLSWFTKPELHGTAVSAVAAGNKYSSTSGPCTGGIAPLAKLYICRIFSGKRFRWEWMINALNHLIDLKKNSGDRIDIVVMSFGSRYSNSDVENKLKELADLGVVIVAAGGNHGTSRDDEDFPSKHNSVISVGALNVDGSVAPYSARNCRIYAPGTSVLVPSVRDIQSITDVCKQSGTSFAAPMLAGFLALLLQSANESPQDVRGYIVKKYHDINFLNTLLRDHTFVSEGKLKFAYRVVQDVQNNPKTIVTLVQAHYPDDAIWRTYNCL